jgi:hypothetical protein
MCWQNSTFLKTFPISCVDAAGNGHMTADLLYFLLSSWRPRVAKHWTRESPPRSGHEYYATCRSMIKSICCLSHLFRKPGR